MTDTPIRKATTGPNVSIENNNGQLEKQTIPMQLGLLVDAQDITLQKRFEIFCREAVDALTAERADGEPVHPAGEGKAEFAVKVRIERLADDSLSFRIEREVKSKLPNIPGKARTATFTYDNGLVQRATPDQFPLFDPEHGQPVPKSSDDITDADCDD